MELFIAIATIFIFVCLTVLSIFFIASWLVNSVLGNKDPWIDYGLDEED